MKNKYYLFIAVALLNSYACTINAQELEEERNEVSKMIAEDTAEVSSKIMESGEKMGHFNEMFSLDDPAEDIPKVEESERRLKGSDEISSLDDSAEDDIENEETGVRRKRSNDMIDELIDELVKEGVDVSLAESSAKIPHRAQRSIKRVKRLLDNLEESKRKRNADKESKNRIAVKKRNSSYEKKHKESEIVDSEEDQAEKQKIKRRAKEEMKHVNSKKGKKRSSKKVNKHARCTEPSACNACQTTTEEFTLPTTTESELCCETKAKCKPTTTRCRTTPSDNCDTCRLKDDDDSSQEQ